MNLFNTLRFSFEASVFTIQEIFRGIIPLPLSKVGCRIKYSVRLFRLNSGYTKDYIAKGAITFMGCFRVLPIPVLFHRKCLQNETGLISGT